MRKIKDAAVVFGTFAMFFLAGSGYALNIISLYNAMGGPFTAQILFRLVGIIFPPIGIVVGWL